MVHEADDFRLYMSICFSPTVFEHAHQSDLRAPDCCDFYGQGCAPMLNQTFCVHIHFAKWFTRPNLEMDSHAANSSLIDECLNALSKPRVSTDSNSITGSTMWWWGVASSNRRQHFNSDGFVAYLSMLIRRYIWAQRCGKLNSLFYLGPYPRSHIVTCRLRVTIRGVTSSNRRHFYFWRALRWDPQAGSIF